MIEAEVRAMGAGGAERRAGGASQAPEPHVPVLSDRVVELLGGERVLEGWVVDGTVGAGGHASALLHAFPGVRVLGIDQDPRACELACRRLAPFGDRAHVVHGRLSALSRIVRELDLEPVVGVLFDLGASSMQLDEKERGFSFAEDGPLDMRMDPSRERTAADIVNRWDESDLADLFYYEGGESKARRIARAVVEERRRGPFRRTLMLADVVARAVGGTRGKIHPATRTFQALRRAVNEEGEELRAGLAAAKNVLAHGGRLAVISFHSGEDGDVKRFFVDGAREGDWRVLTKKPVVADESERGANRRSRSAKLRVAERVREQGRD